jgi:tetratricopeptide (TPR) repeat protein
MPSSREPVNSSAEKFTAPPDPGQARTLDDLVDRLRLLKVWAGEPSYARIKDRVNAAWQAAGRPGDELVGKTTVVGCFRPGRRRVNTDLLIAIVEALHADVGYVAQWRQALRVIGGEVEAAAQVRVQDTLPPDLAEFTGRIPELDRIRQALQDAEHDGGAVVVSAIEGMAGVGKTQLAVHAGHLLMRERPFDRVLFVNLRGFHPDPTQPPADPAAVLDGFLRLLGLPGQQIPHDLPARTAAYRRHLAGARALVVLDNAADVEQVRPLVAGTPGCLTLVTSRRNLTYWQPATRLTVDVFTSDEAIMFLRRAVPEVPIGADPHALARIAERCGHLPLALSLVAGHIRNTPDWTLTDHADRLDERRRHRRLDSGVQAALDLSYQHLPTERQRLLRLISLHPGQDFDVYATAALSGTDLRTAQQGLHQLCQDHLLHQTGPGRYALHDLVTAFAADRATDQDRPPQRHAALTRLFDFHLATAAAAVDVTYPHERQHHPIVAPAGTATPELPDRDRASRWLDTEQANLTDAAQHAALHGWPQHTWRLSGILDRHLRTRGRHHELEIMHQHAVHLAHSLGNRPAEMNALNGLGYVHRRQGHYELAGNHYRQALQIAHTIRDRAGELHALNGLADADWVLGHYERASDHHSRALQIAQTVGDHIGARNALTGLGHIHRMLGRYQEASDQYGRALQIAQEIGDCGGELHALNGLGHTYRMLGDHEQARHHHGRALQTAQEIGDRGGELNAFTGLGPIPLT